MLNDIDLNPLTRLLKDDDRTLVGIDEVGIVSAGPG